MPSNYYNSMKFEKIVHKQLFIIIPFVFGIYNIKIDNEIPVEPADGIEENATSFSLRYFIFSSSGDIILN